MPDSEYLRQLRTEARNPASVDLDTSPALEIARIINAEDAKVAAAVERALPQIAQAIDAVANAITQGGRLIYVGAGTSGRIAAVDAVECPPTFNTDPETVQCVIAGGVAALSHDVEANEDSADSGRRDLGRRRPQARDVVAGIAASGRTPYTVAAVDYARSQGAKTIAITCIADSPLARAAEIAIIVDVGPEVLTGSTRMKAGTAQKMVCNMITTGAMARAGYVYGNLMVKVNARNRKLAARAVGILEQAAAVDRERAAAALKQAGNSVPVALIMLKTGISKAEAQRRLELASGNVRHAIESALPVSAERNSRKA
jgi:N-acetylmuramic acid 6-phosphate etherase